jgi:hypothetical protein
MTTPGWRPAPPGASTLERPSLLVEREDRSRRSIRSRERRSASAPRATPTADPESRPMIAVVQRLWAANAGSVSRQG